MSFEAFFTFVVNHNVVIFQWLVVCVLAIAMLYLGLRIFAKDKLSSDDVVIVERTGTVPVGAEPATSASTASPLAPSVEEIMSQPGMTDVEGAGAAAGSVGDSAPAAGASATSSAAVAAGDQGQLATLQQELKSKELEIATLKSEMENSKGSELDSEDLKAKLEELQAKLAEYEILEDDIADLSHFKEENARLKEEVEALKGGSASPPEEPKAKEVLDDTAEEVASTSDGDVEPAEESKPEEKAAEPVLEAPAAKEPDKEDLMAEFEASLGEEDLKPEADDARAAAEPGSPPAPVTAKEVDDGADFVAEFEAAVQQQKEPEESSDGDPEAIGAETPAAPEAAAKAEPEVPAAAPEAKAEPEVPAATPEPEAKADAEEEADSSMPTGDDILAEFAQSLAPEEETASEPGASDTGIDGSLDTDKVLAEMADLATADATADSGSALEEEMDTEKMAEEASRLLNGE